MNKLDLFNRPVKSYLVYQAILYVIGFVVIIFLAKLFNFNTLNAITGFTTGCLAITIGFLVIVYSSSKVIERASNAKDAKLITSLYFIARYVVYILLCGFAVEFLNANIIAMFIGMLSLKIIIFVDSILNKNGGEF